MRPYGTQIEAAFTLGASGRGLSRFTTNALALDCGAGLIFSNYRAFIQPIVIFTSFAHSHLLIQS